MSTNNPKFKVGDFLQFKAYDYPVIRRIGIVVGYNNYSFSELHYEVLEIYPVLVVGEKNWLIPMRGFNGLKSYKGKLNVH